MQKLIKYSDVVKVNAQYTNPVTKKVKEGVSLWQISVLIPHPVQKEM